MEKKQKSRTVEEKKILRGVKRSQMFSPSLQAALVNIHPVLLSFYYDYFLFEQEAGRDTAKEKKLYISMNVSRL